MAKIAIVDEYLVYHCWFISAVSTHTVCGRLCRSTTRDTQMSLIPRMSGLAFVADDITEMLKNATLLILDSTGRYRPQKWTRHISDRYVPSSKFHPDQCHRRRDMYNGQSGRANLPCRVAGNNIVDAREC